MTRALRRGRRVGAGGAIPKTKHVKTGLKIHE